MRSAGAPAATVLTVMTLVFAPMFGHGHGNAEKLVSVNRTDVTLQCAVHSFCPRHAVQMEKTTAPDDSPAALAVAVNSAVQQGIADYQARHSH
jgi:hypothetical protein